LQSYERHDRDKDGHEVRGRYGDRRDHEPQHAGTSEYRSAIACGRHATRPNAKNVTHSPRGRNPATAKPRAVAAVHVAATRIGRLRRSAAVDRARRGASPRTG